MICSQWYVALDLQEVRKKPVGVTRNLAEKSQEALLRR